MLMLLLLLWMQQGMMLQLVEMLGMLQLLLLLEIVRRVLLLGS